MVTDQPTYSPGTTPPAAGRAGKPWGKWVALGCGGALLLAIVLGAVLFFVVQKATAGPEKVVQEFLAAAGAGDYATAHGHFSAPLAQAQPYEEFARAAADNSMFFRVTETTFNSRSVDGGGAHLAGTVTLESGTTVPASFRLVKENGDWKLIAYQVGS